MNEIINKVKKIIEEEKRTFDLEDVKVSVTKSKTTKSFYVRLYSYIKVEDRYMKIRTTFRYSDHYNSKVKTKLIDSDKMDYKNLKSDVIKTLKSLKKKRLNIKLGIYKIKGQS